MIARIINSIQYRINCHIYKKRDCFINKKIVVIESDDWGSIRMPDKNVHSKLKSMFDFDKCHYCSNDSLLTNQDLDLLAEIIQNNATPYGSKPILTANFVTSNPDFPKIKNSNFQEYFRESIMDTFGRYSDINFNKYRELFSAKILKPQLHGREHLNVSRWMSLLQARNKEFLLAFDNEMFGLSETVTKSNHKTVMAAFDEAILKNEQLESLACATEEFKSIFGFDSKSFIAPNYVWDKDIESILSNRNVEYIQGARAQYIPFNVYNSRKYHYIGEKNIYNQMYLVRNVIFEPSSKKGKNIVNECMNEIESAFKQNSPAIICSHRVNFCGRISVQNRDNTLKQFSELLQAIIKKWPDVTFMTSDQLGDFINKNEKYQ